MEAKRLILETDAAGNLKQLPKLPPNQQVEVIVLMLTNVEEAAPKRRIPHPDIAGKIAIHGDIINTVPETDWNLP